MSYEEIEYLNNLSRGRRERACFRDWMIRVCIQYGGWVLAALMLVANITVRVS